MLDPVNDLTTRRKILILSYVFPPFFSVGGSIRVVKFLKYLPAKGWLPSVLTIDDTKEYDTQRRMGSEELLKELPNEVKIHRTKAGEPSLAVLERGREARRKNKAAAVLVGFLKAVRQFATRFVLLPDENIAWCPHAISAGRRIIRQEGIDVIFATCPPHSVAVSGTLLKFLTGKPFILDFRDDWIDTPWFLAKPWIIRQIERWLERWAVSTADRVILVTSWSQTAFQKRYPKQPPEKFVLIPNGYDLEEFRQLMTTPYVPDSSQFVVFHGGLLSESDSTWRRNPEAFFQAVSEIVQGDSELSTKLKVAFAPHLSEQYRKMTTEMSIEGIIEEIGVVSRDEYLQMLKRAGLLLAINYEGFPTLVPAKLYEYWAVGGPPILLLSCPGAASDLLKEHALGVTVDEHDVSAIKRAIMEAYSRSALGQFTPVSTDGIGQYDRRVLTDKVAEVLAQLVPVDP